jgi:hypothetical protein
VFARTQESQASQEGSAPQLINGRIGSRYLHAKVH